MSPPELGALDVQGDRRSEHLSAEPRTRRSATPAVSVVVPAPGEPKMLGTVFRAIDERHDVVVVGPQTDELLEAALFPHPRTRFVQHHAVKKGSASALRSGFAAASGDIIIALDADSADPAQIPAFVAALVAGADFVKGSRFLESRGPAGMPVHRRFGNSTLTWLVRVLFGGPCSDVCYGSFGFWRDVRPVVESVSVDYAVETAMTIGPLKAGLKVAELGARPSAR